MIIPANSIPIYRKEDNELLGYIQKGSASDYDSWTPLTIFGCSFGHPVSKPEAERQVISNGLSVLTDTWWYKSAEDDEWHYCYIVEAHKNKVKIRTSKYDFAAVNCITIDNPNSNNFQHVQP
jgi:hypothetical protein